MEKIKDRQDIEIISLNKKMKDLSSNIEKVINTWLNIKKINLIIKQLCVNIDCLSISNIIYIEESILVVSLVQLIFYIMNKPLYSKEIKESIVKLEERINKMSITNVSFNIKKTNNKNQLIKAKSFSKINFDKNKEINLRINQKYSTCLSYSLNFYEKIIFIAKKTFTKMYPEANMIIKQLSELCSSQNSIYEKISLIDDEKEKEKLNVLIRKNFQFILSSYFDTLLFSISNPKDSKHLFTFGNNKSKKLSLVELLPKEPFLIKQIPNNKLTLVLDLDECLIHSFNGEIAVCCLSRPYLNSFLVKLKPYYEIGIFTSSAQDYADMIIESIGNDLIDFKLYRQHITESNSNKYKDLSKLGRDMRKIVFIDNCPSNFQLQPDNSFYIKTWENDLYDEQLKGLENILLQIYFSYQNENFSETFDIRKLIMNIKSYITTEYIDKSTNPYSIIKLS